VRSLVPKLLVAAVALLALVWVPAASAAPTYGGSSKVSATEANNLKITAGPDGNVWMTLAGSAKDVAKITPAGAVTEYELPGIANPRGIAAGPEGEGNLWVTFEGGVAKFSPLNPETSTVEFAMPKVKQGSSIVAGPEGRMWVATEGFLISFLPAEPATSEAEVPITGLSPHDIDVAGPRLVIADAGNGRIVTFQPTPVPTLGEIKFVRNPTGSSQGVAGNPNGQVAFSESDGEESLALATPPSPATSTLLKVGDPFGVALGPDGSYYFAMAGDDNVRRLTPTGEVSTITGFPAKFFPRQITAGPGFTLWVAMEIPGGNIVEVARITGVEPPKTVTPPLPPPANPITVTTKPVPDTKFGKGPKAVVKVAKGKATVKFSFSSTVAGSTFQCRLFIVPTGKTGKGKGKKPHGAFTSCRSPKVLHVAPGKYRFGVRAVAAGVTDGSAAERAFTVVRIRPHR
jgi:streptogramin lyase